MRVFRWKQQSQRSQCFKSGIALVVRDQAVFQVETCKTVAPTRTASVVDSLSLSF